MSHSRIAKLLFWGLPALSGAGVGFQQSKPHDQTCPITVGGWKGLDGQLKRDGCVPLPKKKVYVRSDLVYVLRAQDWKAFYYSTAREIGHLDGILWDEIIKKKIGPSLMKRLFAGSDDAASRLAAIGATTSGGITYAELVAKEAEKLRESDSLAEEAATEIAKKNIEALYGGEEGVDKDALFVVDPAQVSHASVCSPGETIGIGLCTGSQHYSRVEEHGRKGAPGEYFSRAPSVGDAPETESDARRRALRVGVDVYKHPDTNFVSVILNCRDGLPVMHSTIRALLGVSGEGDQYRFDARRLSPELLARMPLAEGAAVALDPAHPVTGSVIQATYPKLRQLNQEVRDDDAKISRVGPSLPK